jgi:hypothetical protein
VIISIAPHAIVELRGYDSTSTEYDIVRRETREIREIRDKRDLRDPRDPRDPRDENEVADNH